MFDSSYKHKGPVKFPSFTGIRVMMLPVLLEDIETLPDQLSNYREHVKTLFSYAPIKSGVAYLTIDEQELQPGQTLRRPGLHIDGHGAWGGGHSSPWASRGMLLASTPAGCAAYNQRFKGSPRAEGDCEHLCTECKRAELLQDSEVYFCMPECVHESLPAEKQMRRQMTRLSMPSLAPWFEGYTKNPKGIKPTGPILPRRIFQTEQEVLLK